MAAGRKKPTSKKEIHMEGQQFKPVTILGAGSWGTALALYLARRGQTVRLWSVEIPEVAAMLAERANSRYLPGFQFPDTIQPTANLADAIKDIDDVIIAVPSVGFRETLIMLKPLIHDRIRITCASKGLDEDTGQLLSEVTEEILEKDRPFAVLSGPSFAREVAAGLPAAVVIASRNKILLSDLTQRFNSSIFRIYPSDDVVGVEVGGVVKNVIAIATGISDGMELGANARSALITRGLAEIMRLGIALGGKLETFIGLSGMGDLILTCTDNLSRNRRLGLAIGKGRNVQEAEHEIGQVVEGKRNAELVVLLAERHNVDMPICETVWQILQEKISAKDAVDQLLSRAEKSELSA
ncbi:Glycerol-3-phosphate dehydrogenase [NAD(P)+] [Aquicella lusitana]|uniref:Glycerol-3-phosphate dehydrogenase [NAD(P)+] n=2 Tax=Aquicella lusitana TaxID=254246 RepID=A0A370GIE2_9COXI|nr:glycerol 3-phosphate dehydrogenase (NAD(P)+) [Aquicella lusitana]VVC72669.1 Glycerol-3-phosphate dehydrogenase [NAD(P)+] [Aquicella lusitana]